MVLTEKKLRNIILQVMKESDGDDLYFKMYGNQPLGTKQYVLENDYRKAIAEKGRLMALLQQVELDNAMRDEDSYRWGGADKYQTSVNLNNYRAEIMRKIENCNDTIMRYKSQK